MSALDFSSDSEVAFRNSLEGVGREIRNENI